MSILLVLSLNVFLMSDFKKKISVFVNLISLNNKSAYLTMVNDNLSIQIKLSNATLNLLIMLILS